MAGGGLSGDRLSHRLKMAHMLRDDLHIDSRATDSWLASAEHGYPFLDDKSVLIVDEAGLLSSRQMHRILLAVHEASRHGRHPKLILAGDRNQLQPVGTGSGLRLVAAALPVQSVDAIQRQREPWMREAISAFGKGHAGVAVKAFADRGFVRQLQGQATTVSTLVDEWQHAVSNHPDAGTLMIAATNAEVRAISHHVRQRLRQDGSIAGHDVIIKAATPSGHGADMPIAAGDRIRFLTRARLAGRDVINGTQAVVERVEHHSELGVTIHVVAGSDRFAFTPEEIADKRGRAKLAHAYATTIYGAQGLTTDRAFILLSPDMDRHAVYVAASRARLETTFFIDERLLDARVRADLTLSEKSARQEFDEETRRAFLVKSLARSRLKVSTLDLAEARGQIGDAPTWEVEREGTSAHRVRPRKALRQFLER